MEKIVTILEEYRKTFTVKSTVVKTVNHFTSPQAKKLAEEFGLGHEDFPEDERTGRELKSGLVQISIFDVRKKANVLDDIGVKAFSSKAAFELAKKNNLTPSSFNKKEKITIKDIKALIEENKEEEVTVEEDDAFKGL